MASVAEQQLLSAIDQSLETPAFTVDVITSHEIEFGPNDLQDAPDKSVENEALARKMNQKREQYCRRKPWWDCTERETGGVCAFTQGECKAVPVGQTAKKSYHQKWRELYAGVYGPMPAPKITVDGAIVLPNTTTKRRAHGRKGSLRRPYVPPL